MIDNPYSPNCETPTRPPLPDHKSTWTEFVLFVVIILLASYGLIRLMRDTGVVYHDDQGEHFWFEPQLHEWIHR